MTPAQPAFALRLHGQDFALEPGRDYVLGTSDDCDLRLPLAGPHHLAIRADESGVHFEDLNSGHGTWLQDERVTAGLVPLDATLRLGRAFVQVVVDDGTSRIVPDPTMRLESRGRRIAAAIAQVKQRRAPETFAGMMAEELGRAPWLGLSVLGHLLVILLLWLLVRTPDVEGRNQAVVELHFGTDTSKDLAPTPEIPQVQAEESSPFDLADNLDPEPQAPVAADAAPTPTTSFGASLDSNPRLARRNGSSGLQGVGDVARLGSGGFRKAVGELRKSGLEIVFVFDSTGSMTRTINETKETITEMLDVLRALVPDARIGLVTYRDRGRSEDYITRDVPLGADYWRAVNFVQQVLAEGGGDRPEAVREGLENAFGQTWRAGARRVVVLAGDAPPHPGDIDPLLQRVKAFSKDGRSFVHTLLTSPDLAGDDTRDVFGRIAAAGRGHSVPIGNRDRILQQVLELAVGREFDNDLAAVTASVLENRDQVDTWSLDLARRGGDVLTRELFNQPVTTNLLNALVRMPKKPVFTQLAKLLQAHDTPDHTRQAISWVLQKALHLPMPPVDPVDPRTVNMGVIDRMRRAIERLPD